MTKSLYGLPIEKFRAYGERSLFCWDSLHIALSDGNLSDDNIQFCIDWAKREGDEEGEELGKMLLELTEDQREDFYERINKLPF